MQDTAQLTATSNDIGFFGPETTAAHRDQIIKMMQMIFDALNASTSFDFAQTDLPQRMQNAGMALAESGFVPPPLPIDVLYLQRKFGGIFLLASHLKARVDVMAMLGNLP
jgi:hypothetical protein